jgi:hypothetical protein
MNYRQKLLLVDHLIVLIEEFVTDTESMNTTAQSTSKRKPTIGIDIGRVIIAGEHSPTGGDTSFFSGDDAALFRTPMVPHAFAAITELVEHFEGRAWLVSKCGTNVADRSLRWLSHHGFWATTGIAPESVRFCRERRQKAGIAEALGITHFVDDKHDVISSLSGIVEHRFLFGPQTKPTPAGSVHTPDWFAVLEMVR